MQGHTNIKFPDCYCMIPTQPSRFKFMKIFALAEDANQTFANHTFRHASEDKSPSSFVPSHWLSPNWHFYSDNTLMKRIFANLLTKRCTCITVSKCSVSLSCFHLFSLLSLLPLSFSSARPLYCFLLHALNLSKMADRRKCLLV